MEYILIFPLHLGSDSVANPTAPGERGTNLFRIAIQPDQERLTSGREQSFSDHWIGKLRDAGHEPVVVEAGRDGFFDEVRRCDGFMWWFAHVSYPREFARRVVHAVQHGCRIPTFPTWETVWHFDDKVAQYYLLRAAGIPTARTSILWHYRDAIDFCLKAQYPLVIKLSSGITSENVRLLKNAEEARYWVGRMFGSGVVSLERPTLGGLSGLAKRSRDATRLLVKGVPPSHGSRRTILQKNYLLLQEFLPDNAHDTRVTVIGNRAFAFRRMNRPDDSAPAAAGGSTSTRRGWTLGW